MVLTYLAREFGSSIDGSKYSIEYSVEGGQAVVGYSNTLLYGGGHLVHYPVTIFLHFNTTDKIFQKVETLYSEITKTMACCTNLQILSISSAPVMEPILAREARVCPQSSNLVMSQAAATPV